METELCPTCATPMIARKNKNKGYFAVCPNKENHGQIATPNLAKVPIAAPKPPAPDPPKRKSFLEGTIFG